MSVKLKTRSSASVEELTNRFQNEEAQEVLRWALNEFHPKIALASSFGVEDVVLIHMMWKINPEARVFTLDTGRLHQQTYDTMDKIREKHDGTIEVYFPNSQAVEKMVREHGLNLFYKSVEFRKLCCQVRKVEPLNRALSGLDAWITGLRREQADTRASIGKVELDSAHGGILKINPIADWTTAQVLEYIKANDVPHNSLHDQGFPSIGCAPCTRAILPGENPRAGRWWWEEDAKRECGLHYDPASKKIVRGN